MPELVVHSLWACCSVRSGYVREACLNLKHPCLSGRSFEHGYYISTSCSIQRTDAPLVDVCLSLLAEQWPSSSADRARAVFSGNLSLTQLLPVQEASKISADDSATRRTSDVSWPNIKNLFICLWQRKKRSKFSEFVKNKKQRQSSVGSQGQMNGNAIAGCAGFLTTVITSSRQQEVSKVTVFYRLTSGSEN